jgi:GDP-L-fucose synthase
MIRKFITARDHGQPSVTLWGDGTPTREFIYAPDAAEGMILAAEAYDSSEPVNLGSGHEISIGELATKIAAATGFSGRIDSIAAIPCK